MQPMFIYHQPSYSFPHADGDRDLFARLADNVRAAEAAGFDLVTVMDHFYQIAGIGPETLPMLEAYTTLGALAAITDRVQLGALVSGVTYRNPALLAKQVATLDTISGGRAVLGLGAAWNESEHIGYGFDFPPIGERLDRLEEALEVCRLMLTEERPSFSGRFYRLDRALNVPRPARPGGPPIIVGGGGERRTLRLVARYADIGNLDGSLEDLRRKLDVLAEHCQAVGRDRAEIVMTVMAPIVLARTADEGRRALESLTPERRVGVTVGTPEQCAEVLERYLDAGFGGFVLRNTTLLTPDRIALAGELIALFKER
jgi:F420-dependent oxidoreductase-like protein